MTKKRRSNQETLGEVIDRMLNVYRLRSGLTEIQLTSDWGTIVGEVVASRTDKLKLYDKVLTIHMSSAAMRQELHYQRTDIIQNINNHFGSEVVKEIRLS